MSRTTRKPRWYCEHSDVSFENRALELYRDTKLARRRRPKKEYEEEYQKVLEEHHKFCEENGYILKKYSIWSQQWITYIRPMPYVPRYNYSFVPYSKEECVDDARKERKKLTRDGHCSESGRKKFYKKLSKKEVRNEWKRMKNKIMKDEEYDEFYPHDKLGKKFIWSVW